MHRVFVYGTLKRGFCRHDALQQQAFLGLARTEANYKLFDLGEYPGLIVAEDGISIEGELYCVDDDCLAKLDQVEGVDEGYYSRESVMLQPPWNDEATLTYIYRKPIAGHSEIPQWPSK